MLGIYYFTEKQKQKEGIHLLEKAEKQGNDFSQYNLAVLAKKNLYVKIGENFLSVLIKAAEHYDKVNISWLLFDEPFWFRRFKKRWISINN